MGDKDVSSATVARLPNYLRSVMDLAAEDVANVSSDRLANHAGVNPATLRRDLASLGVTGTRGVGYDIKYLTFQISVILGVNQEWPVAVVGAGNIGRALTSYQGLASRGFPVRAVFDIAEDKIGTEVSGLVVEPLSNVSHRIPELNVTVGVIATSADAAQSVAQLLIDAGIQSILNFTADSLDVPEGVTVRRVDLATELQILSFYQQRESAVADGTGIPLKPKP